MRVEVRDEGPRGRGLGIAARAVEEAGGVLEVERAEDGTTVAVELPLAADAVSAARAPAPARLVLLSLALACGGLAASEVGSRVREVEARVGAPVPVLVAARELDAGRAIEAAATSRCARCPSGSRRPTRSPRPRRWSGAAPGGAAGARGLPHRVVARRRRRRGGAPGALRRGERAVEVAVTGGAGLAEAAGPGARVDVLVSTEPREGPGRSFLALEDVEVLDLARGRGRRAGGRGRGRGPRGRRPPPRCA